MEIPRDPEHRVAEEPDGWISFDIDSSIPEDMPAVCHLEGGVGVYNENLPQRNNPLVPVYQEEPLEHTIFSFLSTEPLSIPVVPSLSGSSGPDTPEAALTPLPCHHSLFVPHEIDLDLLSVGKSHGHRTSRSPSHLSEVASQGRHRPFSAPDGASLGSAQSPFYFIQATGHHELQQWPSPSSTVYFTSTPRIAGLAASSASDSRRSTGSDSQKHDLSETPKGTTDKRRRLTAKPSATPGEESSSDENDSGDGTDKKPSPQPGKKTQRLACPFLRRNPLAHKNCLNIKIKRIRDLKQHLRRAHYPPKFYCPVCLKEYALQDPWEQHIQSRQCQPPAQKPERNNNVVSKEAQYMLSQRANRKQSEREQYYTIWDGLFGEDTPRPLNPHLGDMVEEALNLVSDFWRNKASEMIPPLLEARPGYSGKAKEVEDLMLDLFDEVKIKFGQTFGEDTRGDSDSTLKQCRGLAPTLAPEPSKISSPPCSDLQQRDTLAGNLLPRVSLPNRYSETSKIELFGGSNQFGDAYWYNFFPQAEENGFSGIDHGSLSCRDAEEQHSEVTQPENLWTSAYHDIFIEDEASR